MHLRMTELLAMIPIGRIALELVKSNSTEFGKKKLEEVNLFFHAVSCRRVRVIQKSIENEM